MDTQPPPSRNDPCPCGSGRKFKKCCGSPAAAAPSSPAQPWHDLDDRVIKDLTAFGRRRFGDGWAHVLGDYPVDEREMESMPAHMNLFIQWACHENKFESEPLARHYLESRGRNLPAGDRAWLEAQQRAWLSIWEVVDLQEGAWLDIVDLLTGERRRVIEISGSRGLHPRLTLLARVVDHASVSLLCGSHPQPLARRPLPQLTNTDGEELVLVKDTFALVGAGAKEDMAKRLATQPGIQQPPEGPRGAFVIEARKEGASEEAPSTVIGRVTMTARELRLETNSRERADRLRDRLERIADGQIRHKGRDESDTHQMLAEATKAKTSGRQRHSTPLQGPAAEAAVLSFKRAHYAGWVDHPLPALEGLSPREATANPGLRARLSLLLKEMEGLEGRGPAGQRFDFGEIRRQLGMGGP